MRDTPYGSKALPSPIAPRAALTPVSRGSPRERGAGSSAGRARAPGCEGAGDEQAASAAPPRTQRRWGGRWGGQGSPGPASAPGPAARLPRRAGRRRLGRAADRPRSAAGRRLRTAGPPRCSPASPARPREPRRSRAGAGRAGSREPERSPPQTASLLRVSLSLRLPGRPRMSLPARLGEAGTAPEGPVPRLRPPGAASNFAALAVHAAHRRGASA